MTKNKTFLTRRESPEQALGACSNKKEIFYARKIAKQTLFFLYFCSWKTTTNSSLVI